MATQEPRLRFAVSAFETWEQLRGALDVACLNGLVLDSINCLGLERVVAGTIFLVPGRKAVAVKPLPFPGHSESIACTAGLLMDRLTDRVRSGSRTLQEALARWL